jgi:hypothetical protein
VVDTLVVTSTDLTQPLSTKPQATDVNSLISGSTGALHNVQNSTDRVSILMPNICTCPLRARRGVNMVEHVDHS